MTTNRLRVFAAWRCAAASLFYAAKMKRAGHGHFGVAIPALIDDHADIVYSGPMPSAVRERTLALAG